jgi:hypothetical protein
MKTIEEVAVEVRQIIKECPVLEDRFKALAKAGYNHIVHSYTKSGGIGQALHLKNKRIWRIQVSQSELKKGYPAAWCVEVDDKYINEYVGLVS